MWWVVIRLGIELLKFLSRREVHAVQPSDSPIFPPRNTFRTVVSFSCSGIAKMLQTNKKRIR